MSKTGFQPIACVNRPTSKEFVLDQLSALPELRYQFKHQVFHIGQRLSTLNHQPIFNQTITLKDTWAKEVQKS